MSSLFDTLVDLTRNPESRAAFDADPAGFLRQAGLADVTPQEIHDAAPLVAETIGTSMPATGPGDAGGAIGQIHQLVHIAGPELHAPTAGHDTAFQDVSADLDHRVPTDHGDLTIVEPTHQTVPEKVSSELSGLEREAHAHGYPDGQSYLQAEQFRPIQEVVYDQAPDAAHSTTYLRQVVSLAHDAGYANAGEFVRDAQHGLDPAVSGRLMLADEAHAAGYPDVQHYLDAWHDGQVDLDDGSVGSHDVLRALARDAGQQHESLEDLLNSHNHGGPAFQAPPEPGDPPFVHHAGASEPDLDALTREAHAHGFPDAQHYLDAAPFAAENNVYFRAPDAGQDFSQLKAVREMAHDAGYDDVADFGRATAHGLSESDHARILLAQEARANGYPDARSYLDAYHHGQIDVRDPNHLHPDDRIDYRDNHDVLRWLAKESTTHGHAGIDDYLNSGLHHGQEAIDAPGIVYTREPVETHDPIDHMRPIHIGQDGVVLDPQTGGPDPGPDAVFHPHVDDVWYEHASAGHGPGLDDPAAAHQGEPGEHRVDPHGAGEAVTGPVDNRFGSGHTEGGVDSGSGVRTAHDDANLHHDPLDHDGTGVRTAHDDANLHHDTTHHDTTHYGEDQHGGNTDHSLHESSSGGEDHHTDPGHAVFHGG